nr:ABC transporter permease [Marinicella sp. W31]MDC2876273.1 ABC transporter permease [Marinicella sp. W31]
MTAIMEQSEKPVHASETRLLFGEGVRFLKAHREVTIVLLMLVAMALVGVFAPLLAGDPMAINPAMRYRPPSAEHWLGTDKLGRDVYARLIYGTRNSMTVGFAVAGITTVIGVAIGVYAGFFSIGGAIVMRLNDAMMSIPAVLLAIALASLMEQGLAAVIVAITVPEIPRMVRVVRALVLGIRRQPYLAAAVSIGTRGLPLVFRHVLPNMLGPVLVQATYACASAVITSAVLAFLGVGVSPDIPSWGGMMAAAKSMFRLHPELMLYPGLALSLLVLLVNILGDRLSDAVDPRKARRGIL